MYIGRKKSIIITYSWDSCRRGCQGCYLDRLADLPTLRSRRFRTLPDTIQYADKRNIDIHAIYFNINTESDKILAGDYIKAHKLYRYECYTLVPAELAQGTAIEGIANMIITVDPSREDHMDLLRRAVVTNEVNTHNAELEISLRSNIVSTPTKAIKIARCLTDIKKGTTVTLNYINDNGYVPFSSYDVLHIWHYNRCMRNPLYSKCMY